MKQLIVSLIMLFMLMACSPSSDKKKQENSRQDEKPMGLHPHPEVAEGECAHCGMPTEDFKQWNAFIEHENNHYTFCSTRCMLATKLEHKENWGADARFQVTDYYTLKVLDADSAFYIMDSDVAGPMGKDFMVVDSREASADFIKDHGGQNPVMLADIDMKMLMEAVR